MMDSRTLGERIGDMLAPYLWVAFVYFAWPFLQRGDFKHEGFSGDAVRDAAMARRNRLSSFSIALYAAALVSALAMTAAEYFWEVISAAHMIFALCGWIILHTHATILHSRS